MSGRPDGYGLRVWSFTEESEMIKVKSEMLKWVGRGESSNLPWHSRVQANTVPRIIQ
jgi:hypothetical protein